MNMTQDNPVDQPEQKQDAQTESLLSHTHESPPSEDANHPEKSYILIGGKVIGDASKWEKGNG